MVAESKGGIVAVGRLTRESGGGSAAEFAVQVARDWQKAGLGEAIMRQLASIAKSEGIASMGAGILAGETGMEKLCRKLGFKVEDTASGLRADLAL
jgi:acetyltransferase